MTAAEAHNAYLNNAEDYNKTKIIKKDYLLLHSTNPKTMRNPQSQSTHLVHPEDLVEDDDDNSLTRLNSFD
jgi:hypothetical protein